MDSLVNPKQIPLGHSKLEFGYYLGFGAWRLVLCSVNNIVLPLYEQFMGSSWGRVSSGTRA
jgi:hypothetical protein